ncbi:UDP-N-acetylglucosamine 1-carboxyvinyltransferase, partial [Patescibacteria group bacterium]|nr:UDP-N-acetylglucosamine 1-carboxyvinyltransferase [Patescibacteria group bacterium]
MTERFIIQGGKPLEGEIEVRGYKNAAGAILAASLLTDKEVILENLPLVEDIFDIVEVLKSIGVKVEWRGERSLSLKAYSLEVQKMDFEKISKTRVSVLLIGSLLARCKNFKIPHPGGDRIGLRPIFTHIEALKKLGVEVSENGDFYEFTASNLTGREIVLKEFSVTATENLMMATVLAKGKTIIKGAAAEPKTFSTIPFRTKLSGWKAKTAKIRTEITEM